MPDLSHIKNTEPEVRLHGLDHLRALAIILVFLYHYRQLDYPGWIPSVGSFGWSGVDLFFVLSGFLIASQLFSKIVRGKSISLKEYFLKRFFRIIPAYLAIVAIYFCIPPFREREALPPLWKFLTFTQNFGVDIRNHSTFSHAWSLCIEEQFYFLLPLTLIMLVAFKQIHKGYVLLLLLFLAGFAARFYCWEYLVTPQLGTNGFSPAWYKWIYYPTYSRLDGLLTGITIAGIFRFLPKLKNRLTKYGNLNLALSITILTIAGYLTSDKQTFTHTVFGFPLVAIGYGMLVLGALSSSSILYRFQSGITKKIATLSYAIYLSHKGIIHLTQEYLSGSIVARDSNLMFVLCVGTAFLGAFILNKLVEVPFMKLRDKILTSDRKQTDVHLALKPTSDFNVK